MYADDETLGGIFHSIHFILQQQNFYLVPFFVISISLLNFSFSSCSVFPACVELSFCVFLQLAQLLQDNYFEFFLGKLQFSFSLGLVTGKFLWQYPASLIFSRSLKSCVVVFVCEDRIISSIFD